MDPEVFTSQPMRIGGSGKVSILSTQHLNPEYDIVCRSDLKATRTGLVTLIYIAPKKGSILPSFVLRWDRNYDTVDVDIYVKGKNKKELWKKSGYSGHHTTRIKGPWRRFKVDIQIPERKVFEGVVNIGLFIAVNLALEIEPTVSGKFILRSNLPLPTYLKPIRVPRQKR